MFLTIMPDITDAARLRRSPNSIHSHFGQLQLSKNPDIVTFVTGKSDSARSKTNNPLIELWCDWLKNTYNIIDESNIFVTKNHHTILFPFSFSLKCHNQ